MSDMFGIKNYIEMAVTEEVSRQKAKALRDNAGCWCQLCEADIISLSLTTLPPRYCMEHSYALMEQKTIPGTVKAAVSNAANKVSLRPKHKAGLPEYSPLRLRIINLALEEGAALVRSVLQDYSSPCLCRQCLADTLAFALNRFPPQYGVECDGACRFTPLQREFFRHDLTLVLGQAARAVASHPHH